MREERGAAAAGVLGWSHGRPAARGAGDASAEASPCTHQEPRPKSGRDGCSRCFAATLPVAGQAGGPDISSSENTRSPGLFPFPSVHLGVQGAGPRLRGNEDAPLGRQMRAPTRRPARARARQCRSARAVACPDPGGADGEQVRGPFRALDPMEQSEHNRDELGRSETQCVLRPQPRSEDRGAPTVEAAAVARAACRQKLDSGRLMVAVFARWLCPHDLGYRRRRGRRARWALPR